MKQFQLLTAIFVTVFATHAMAELEKKKIPCYTSKSSTLQPVECRFTHYSDNYSSVQFYNSSTNFITGGSSTKYTNIGKPDGNGIVLPNAPDCFYQGTCELYTGRVLYWKGKKKTYYVATLHFDSQGRPSTAQLQSLAEYGGRVERR